jgi:hypothetical protein
MRLSSPRASTRDRERGGEGGLTRIADGVNSEETVKRHLTAIFDKTGMSTRLELAMYAVKHGIGN